MQCPVTCGGGVRSRTVTCALAPKKTCDLSTKPRSRSLCGLQSCPNSGLRRRPGPPPKYRRVFPPKSHPTEHPGTWAPTSTTTTAAPTAAITVRKETTTKETTTAFIPTTTSLSTLKTTIPEITDMDDHEFDVKARENEDKRGKGVTSKAKDRKATGVETEKVEEREEGEEGSTPNVLMYTPGYDYVVEERTTEEEGIIDLDVTTSTSHKNPLKSTTPTPNTLITPTLQTSPPTVHTTKEAATYSTPHTSTETWAKTTHRYPFTHPRTTPRIDPYSQWTHRVPLTTPMYRSHPVPSTAGFHTTRAPSTTARKPFTTAATPTVKIVKLKKPAAVTPKKNSSVSRAKKPSSWSKGQKQQTESPSDQSNVKAREPVSMDIFWVAGNWSEVSADILLPKAPYQ